MLFCILSIIFFIFFLVLYVAYIVDKKSVEEFNKTAVYTEGTILARKMVSDGYMDEYEVEFTCKDGQKRMVISQPCKLIAKGGIPVGTTLKIAYADLITFGITATKLRIIDENYVKNIKTEPFILLRVLSAVFAITTIIMLLLGIFVKLN